MVYQLLGLLLSLNTHLALAQDFAPPRPPPLDPASDFEDMEEDMVEMGDEGYRPPPPPTGAAPLPGGGPGAPPPNIRPDMGPPGNSAFGSSSNSKLKFQIVEGEFYEKGKKRGRGKKLRASGS